MTKLRSPLFWSGAVLGVVLAALGILLLRGASVPAFAAPVPEPQTSNYFIMTPGTLANGNACLWVIDTRNSDDTPSLAFYTTNGSQIKLQAARRIKYDLRLLGYNDGTDPKYGPIEMGQKINEMNDQEAKKNKK
jgi:hypothetical protein